MYMYMYMCRYLQYVHVYILYTHMYNVHAKIHVHVHSTKCMQRYNHVLYIRTHTNIIFIYHVISDIIRMMMMKMKKKMS